MSFCISPQVCARCARSSNCPADNQRKHAPAERWPASGQVTRAERRAPEDEYYFEGQEIDLAISRLDKRDEDDLMHVIEKVWQKFFELGAEDIELRRDAFRRAARRILIGSQRGGQV